tara:strand:+ start:57 stop:488 length:432 start_codon:yes stop_codon:yes gene_type:complete
MGQQKLIILLLLFISCTSTKSILRDKTKIDKEEIQSGEQTIKRASDTILMTIPTIKYKDTIIYKRGRKSTVYINYDKQGTATIKSVCDSIAIFKKWYNQINVNQKNDVRDKAKETQINGSFILYIFLGLAGLIVVMKLSNKFI